MTAADAPARDGELSAEQADLCARVRAYVGDVVVPARARLDAVRRPADFPWDVVEPGCDLGLRTLPLPVELGGRGADMTTLVLVAEELAAGDLGVAYYFKHNWRFARLLPRLPASLRDTVLDRLRHDPRFLPASAMTEEQAGSDNNLPYDAPGAGLALRARRDDEHWVLDGRKAMITNGGMAGLYFVGARTDPDVGVREGVTLFAVPGDAPGLTCGPPYGKVGQRASLQADLVLDGVRVPLDHAVSEVGDGLAASQRALVAANLVNAGMAVGLARAAYEEALGWCASRVQGGAPIFRHQLVARDLGAMRVDLDAARAFTWHTARAFARSQPGLAPELVSAANAFATEAAVRITRAAMDLFGGRGMMTDWPAEKLLRDALTLGHANGTNALLLLKLGTRDAERAAAL